MRRRTLLGLAGGLTAAAVAGCAASGPTSGSTPTGPGPSSDTARAGATPQPRTPATAARTPTDRATGPSTADPTTPTTRSSAPQKGPMRLNYGTHPSQYAELTVPAGADPVPVVVIVHGGFWRIGYDAELGRPLAADLVPRGWATLNVEYRRVGRSATEGGGGWPTTCTDVAAAVDILLTEGQRLAGQRLDLSRVVALGHSAGGQLVGWLGGRGTLPGQAPGASPAVKLRGFVAQAGVMDLVGAAREEVGGSAVPDLMGAGPDEAAEAYAWASPLGRLPMGIPSVCVHGRSDTTVPITQSQRFVTLAQKLGDRAELQEFAGDHFDVITVGTPAWTLCVDALTRLLG